MHIVIVHRGMFPERIGGTYTYIYEVGRGLTARGHQVDVIASTREREPRKPYDLEGMTVHTYTYRRVNPVYSTLQHLRRSSELFHSIHQRSPVDILSVQDSHLGLRAAKSALGRSVCQVPTYHAPVFLEFRFNTEWRTAEETSLLKRIALRLTEPPLEHWQRRFERGVLEQADGILVLSDFSRSLIEEFFPTIDLDKIRIIQGGVDAERFAPADDRGAVRRRLGLGDHVYLITVRNLMPRMGLQQLVEAMSIVARSHKDVRLLICGAGPLRETLESMISERGLGGVVTLVGRVSDEDLVRYYQVADAFVLPTTAMEGFGISTVEALSVNLPVIGTPAGATPEILEPIDPRLLTRDATPEAIAGGIMGWLEWRAEDPDPGRYRQTVLQKYAWPRVVDATEEYYKEMLGRYRVSARLPHGEAK